MLRIVMVPLIFSKPHVRASMTVLTQKSTTRLVYRRCDDATPKTVPLPKSKILGETWN